MSVVPKTQEENPPENESRGVDHLWVSSPGCKRNFYSDAACRFTIVTAGRIDPRNYLEMDAYSAAKAFVNGKFEVHGDICEAIRHFTRLGHPVLRQIFFSGLAHVGHWRTSFLLGNRKQSAQDVQFHYDRSNEFYAQFLDSRMVYSAAHFRDPEDSLETAQRQKLDAICHDLALCPEDIFLNIGCGWGGLVIYAAEQFGVQAVGCTLAPQQLSFAQNTIEEHGFQETVAVKLCDYRELAGQFDKIASVGMFEHVGRRRLGGYFRKVFELLRSGGLFLNRGVIRPQGVFNGPEITGLKPCSFKTVSFPAASSSTWPT